MQRHESKPIEVKGTPLKVRLSHRTIHASSIGADSQRALCHVVILSAEIVESTKTADFSDSPYFVAPHLLLLSSLHRRVCRLVTLSWCCSGELGQDCQSTSRNASRHSSWRHAQLVLRVTLAKFPCQKNDSVTFFMLESARELYSAAVLFRLTPPKLISKSCAAPMGSSILSQFCSLNVQSRLSSAA